MLRRDGFGYLSTIQKEPGQFTTTALPRPASGGSVYVNAEGLGEDAYLRIEVIDKQGQPVEGYSGSQAALVKQSGLKVKLNWSGKTTLSFPSISLPLENPVRRQFGRPDQVLFGLRGVRNSSPNDAASDPLEDELEHHLHDPGRCAVADLSERRVGRIGIDGCRVPMPVERVVAFEPELRLVPLLDLEILYDR